VQWILAIPHLVIAGALRSLRQVLTLISFERVASMSGQLFIITVGTRSCVLVPSCSSERSEHMATPYWPPVDPPIFMRCRVRNDGAGGKNAQASQKPCNTPRPNHQV
jgi:hypothetical protein